MRLKNRLLGIFSAMTMLGAANADTLTYTGVIVASGAIDGNDLTGQTATISITFADGLTASGGVYSLGVISAASYEFSDAGLFTIDTPQDNLEFGSPLGFDVSFFDEDFSPLAMLSGTTAGSAGLAPLDGETLADMFARLGDGTNIAFTQSTDFQMLNAIIGTLNGGASSITGDILGGNGSAVTLTLSPSNETVVIDFQALEHVDGNTTPHGDSYSEDGFTLNGPTLTTFGTLESRYPGSTAIFSNANTGLIEVVQDNGGAYSAESVDLVPLNNGDAPTTVIFNGELDGVNVANQSFTTNSIGFVLETFNFNSDFANIDRLTWTQDSPFNQVDNISVLPVGKTVIDFEALEHVDGNTTNHGDTYSEDGFTLNGPSLTTFGTLESRYPGSTAIFSNANTGLIEVVQDNGGAYSAESVDLVPLNNGDAPTTVIFNGELDGVNVANQSFTTNSIGFVLETFNFNSDFANIDRLTWTQDSPFNQVDNISVFPASDPGCPADLDGDGDADADDFFAYLDAFAGGNLPVCDIDGDGDCDADDFFGYLDLFAQGC